MNVKDVWLNSYDEEETLRSLAWTESLVTKQPQRLGGLYICSSTLRMLETHQTHHVKLFNPIIVIYI